MRTTRLLLALPAVVVLACQSGDSATSDAATVETDPAAVRAEIDRGNQRMEDLVSRAAFDSIGQLYTADAVILAPNMGPLVGTDSVRSFWVGGGEMGLKSLDLQTTDVEISGDFAVETGSYTVGIQPQGAAQITDRGKYLVVWKRQADGSWKIHRDIYNTSMPAPTGQ